MDIGNIHWKWKYPISIGNMEMEIGSVPIGTMLNDKSLRCTHLFYIHVFNILYFTIKKKRGKE